MHPTLLGHQIHLQVLNQVLGLLQLLLGLFKRSLGCAELVSHGFDHVDVLGDFVILLDTVLVCIVNRRPSHLCRTVFLVFFSIFLVDSFHYLLI